jgi:RHS repeat-associated protein
LARRSTPGVTEPELFDYDEFGVPLDGHSNQRYGWLGGKQRSGEAMGDVILMGVRLYSPSLGRFLQTDPEDGGNATAYDYCAGDPVNCTDLDGNFGWGPIKRGLSKVAKISSYASMIPGPIGRSRASCPWFRTPRPVTGARQPRPLREHWQP